MENLKYRLYGFVPYSLSGIQKGIQFGHAAIEYSNYHGKSPEYWRWAFIDKTFIILNGGTTNKTPGKLGSLNLISNELVNRFKLKVETFHEPDLGDQLTAVVFLVNDRIYDKETWDESLLTTEELELRNYLKGFNLA